MQIAKRWFLENSIRYYKVRVDGEVSDITEHLEMNGYDFDTNDADSIFISEEEIEYLMTILDDRGYDYVVE